MNNLYSIIYLTSSILGAWILNFSGRLEIIPITLLYLISGIVCWFIFKLFLFYQEKKTLLANNLSVNFYTFQMQNQTHYHIYSCQNNLHSNVIIDINHAVLNNIFLVHNKVYSELVERVLSREYFKYLNVIPSSNGCSAHIDDEKSKYASYTELLERDSIILYYYFEIPPIYSIQGDQYLKDIKGKFYFFTTNDPNFLSCLYYEKPHLIGYSTISSEDYINLNFKDCLKRSFNESIASYSSAELAIHKAKEIKDNQSIQDYFEEESDVSHSGQVYKMIVENNQWFSFLEKYNLSKPESYNLNFWESNHPFNKIDIQIKTNYEKKYGRYFSYPEKFDHVYPVWPIHDKAQFHKMEKRLKSNFIGKYKLHDKKGSPFM